MGGRKLAGQDLFAIGGEVGKLMSEKDWSSSPVGAIENWPQDLKSTVRIVLGSYYPMWICWGPHRVMFYNDAYIPLLGKRHPDAIGQNSAKVWNEIWHIIGPMIDQIFNEGKSLFFEEMRLIMERKGFREETFFTFSYSPISNDDGNIGGMFCTCFENTGKVLSRRRLSILRDLPEVTSKASTVREVLDLAHKMLQDKTSDIAFALTYLITDEKALLVGSNFPDAQDQKNFHLNLSSQVNLLDENTFLSLDIAYKTKEPLVIDVSQMSLLIKDTIDPVRSALVIPIFKPNINDVSGFWIAGINPYLEINEEYRGFLSLLANQLAAAIGNASAFEEERLRLRNLQELDQAKTAFFNNISHEFRTPLTLLVGPIEELLSGNKGSLEPEACAELVLMRRNANRLLKLVNTLLEFARLEAGKVTAIYEPTDLATFTIDLASTFRSTMEGAELNFVVDCPRLPEPIYIDRDKWERVVLNLLSNAFKFTLEGSVKVSLKAGSGHVIFEVADSGVGIAQNELSKLFQRFHRVQGSNGRSYEGTGIGLALVKELVELHGGTISVASVKDKGTTFTVKIPTGFEHLPKESVSHTVASTASIGKATTHFVEEANFFSKKTETETKLSQPNSDKSNQVQDDISLILVADDNVDMRNYIVRLISPFWRIIAVANGREALNSARKFVPDLIISDIMMPEIDGIELVNLLKKEQETRDIPVILLSARAGEHEKNSGLNLGAEDYLVKPFVASELISRVRRSLAKHKRNLTVLKTKNEELLRANNELRTFAFISAHDLKEPLRMVKLNIQQLIDDTQHSFHENEQKNIEYAVEGVTRMFNLIDSLLSYLVIEKDVEKFEMVDTKVCLKNALSSLQFMIDESDANIQNSSLPVIFGNQVQLEQLFQNLLSNAIKFRSGPSPLISVAVRDQGTHWHFSFSDNGIGIDYQHRDRVFEVFQRLHTRKQYPGNGIGLSICKKIVENHNGKIWVESDLAKGSTFHFTLSTSHSVAS